MKLAVIGLGFMGSTHVKAARTLPGLELAVCSRDPKKLSGDFSDIRGNIGDAGGNVDLSGMAKYGDIGAVDAGGNMAGPLLAQYIGGGPDSFFGNFMLAFVSAVAFATINIVSGFLITDRMLKMFKKKESGK